MAQFCVHCGVELGGTGAFCHACGAPKGNIAGVSGTMTTQAAFATAAEKVFYNSNDVKVTSTRFIVPGQTYAMAGVTSVRFEKIPPKNGWGITLIVIGLLLLLPEDSRATGAILLIIGIAIVALVKSTYAVALHSASGESRAIVSKDSGFVDEVVRALNDSIVYRK